MFYIFTKKICKFLKFLQNFIPKTFWRILYKFLKKSLFWVNFCLIPFRSEILATPLVYIVWLYSTVQYSTGYNELHLCLKFCPMSLRFSPEPKSWICLYCNFYKLYTQCLPHQIFVHGALLGINIYSISVYTVFISYLSFIWKGFFVWHLRRRRAGENIRP